MITDASCASVAAGATLASSAADAIEGDFDTGSEMVVLLFGDAAGAVERAAGVRFAEREVEATPLVDGCVVSDATVAGSDRRSDAAVSGCDDPRPATTMAAVVANTTAVARARAPGVLSSSTDFGASQGLGAVEGFGNISAFGAVDDFDDLADFAIVEVLRADADFADVADFPDMAGLLGIIASLEPLGARP